MNNNLQRLCQINILLDELIYIDLKINTVPLTQIINLILQIKSNISFLITEFFFMSIIEFEQNKKQILCKLVYVKNIFFTYLTNNAHITEKIIYIINVIKQIIYPAYLNINNVEKYIKEIKQTKIKFYHKSGTIDKNLYDKEIELEDKEIKFEDKKRNGKKISNIKIKSYNNKNYVINKIKGKKFISNIDFTKSHIVI